ncbi:AAA family ATPase [Nocardiopsis sp. NPDC049922]|uniref:AAA family ATPase n=1 Tax=Nocardiopsis sp. NPDC049922 TaxID=3155157 RepID=UPI0033D9026F
MTSSPSSDRRPGRLLVLEGMPGAGKTTAATHLNGRLPVVAEYTTPSGRPLGHDQHPNPHQDQAHQDNWLIKATLCARYLAANPLVACDRDWLTALAFAYSHPDQALFPERCAWAWEHLRAQRLHVATTYAVLHVDTATSLTRRQNRLRPDHPWSTVQGLDRLAEFYREPASAIHATHPALALALNQARFVHMDGHQPPEAVLEQITANLERV